MRTIETATKRGARENLYRWIAAGPSSGIALNVLAWMYWPRLDAPDQPFDRLLLALQCCAGVGVVTLTSSVAGLCDRCCLRMRVGAGVGYV